MWEAFRFCSCFLPEEESEGGVQAVDVSKINAT